MPRRDSEEDEKVGEEKQGREVSGPPDEKPDRAAS
jgi:hypothetical protein